MTEPTPTVKLLRQLKQSNAVIGDLLFSPDACMTIGRSEAELDGLWSANHALLAHLSLANTIGRYFEEPVRSALMATDICDLPLSTRPHNCLTNHCIHTVADLCQYSDADLMKMRNFGRKTLREVKEVLTTHGLMLAKSRRKVAEDEGVEPSLPVG